MSRRNRSANFSPIETRLFKKLVEKYKHILDDKTCDRKTNQRKAMAWEHMAKIYNRLSPVGVIRSAEHLKNKYLNTKKNERKRRIHEVLDDTGDESSDEKIDDIDDMDPIDFAFSECSETHTGDTKPNYVHNSASSMSNGSVDGFVSHLRKNSGHASTSYATGPNDTVSNENDNPWLFSSHFYDAIKMENFHFQNCSTLNPETGEMKNERVLHEMDFNDDLLNDYYDSDNSDSKFAKKLTSAQAKVRTGSDKNDLEELQRTLIKRKILLCNLQIELARKQLEAYDKPESWDGIESMEIKESFDRNYLPIPKRFALFYSSAVPSLPIPT